MKVKILIVVFGLLGFFCKAQFPNTQTIASKTTLFKPLGGIMADSGNVVSNKDTTTTVLNYYDGLAGKGSSRLFFQGVHYYRYNGAWNAFLNYTLADARYVQIQTQSPTASLSGGGNYELHSAGTFASTLSWGAGRQAATPTVNATNPLASIVVASVSQTFSQPSAGSTVSGTQGVTITYNTNVTYSNVVTTTDAKTATATTSYNFFPKYYIGYSTTNSPSDADLIAGINTIFPATTRVTSGTLASPASSSYIFFAVPASFGIPIVTINAAGVTYNNTIRSVTNASGYTQSYIISVSPFPTAAGVLYSIN